VWSTVGCTISFLHKWEIDTVIWGQDLGSRMQAMFENDRESSKAITPEYWVKRSLLLRLKKAAASL
jgi:hypothetical protein